MVIIYSKLKNHDEICLGFFGTARTLHVLFPPEINQCTLVFSLSKEPKINLYSRNSSTKM